jgi:3-hydroxyisobutyrate dehydrogenase
MSGRVVFAGLGQMGFHMARHVAGAAADRGVAFNAYDIDPTARQRMADAGDVAVIDALPGDLGAGDVLGLSVPDGTATRAAVASLGPLDGAGGLMILDFSSVSPADARAIAAELQPFGVTYLDAPVTGGVVGAEQGTLTTIVGAGEEALGDVRWIAESFSGRVVAAGTIGAGALLKTINNMIFNIGSLATMEGIVVARKAGIPDDTLLEVLNNGTAATWFTGVRYPKYIRTRRFDAGMRVGLVNKDLGIALDAAAEAGCDLRLCGLGREMWADALAALGPDADSTLMMDVVARATAGAGILDLLEDA